jgi:23S rRNA (guanosine2251-2'-O)-methyltransferase
VKGKNAGRMVCGVGPVKELLASAPSQIDELRVATGRVSKGDTGRGRRDPVADIADKGRRLGIRVTAARMGDLDRMVGQGQRHQGVVALTKEFEYCDIDDILAAANAADENPLVVALDGVTDPHNLGAIARSAYLLGAHGLVLPRDRSAKVNATSAKVSAGAVEHLAIAQVTNLSRALTEAKEAGLWIAAVAAGDKSTPLGELDFQLPLLLVLGSEGKGLRPQVAKQCDFTVEIPMSRSGVGSFNVSVAAALALYEAHRQRGNA